MPYVQGFLIPVPHAKKDAYIASAAVAAPIFREYGVLRQVECWGDDIRDGEVTDFHSAVKATADETVVFAWMVRPDKATCQAAEAKIEADERFRIAEMPFDGRRMIYGGFVPIFDTDG